MPTSFDKAQLCIQPPGEGADPGVSSDVAPPQASGPLVASGDRVQESEADSNSLGYQLLEAIRQVMATRPWEEPVVVTPAPPTKEVSPPPAPPLDIQASLAAVERATSEDEVVAALKTFFADVAIVFTGVTDPIAALTTVFGTESVAAVTEVCAAAVADLEAEAAVTGGAISDRAGSRIARSMVRRLTMRAGRTLDRAPRAHPALRGRVMRAPRSRRVRHRAVRLSAVASAGDGPPPPEPLATTCSRDRAQLARTDDRHLLVAPVDDALACLVDLREQELTSRAAHDGQRAEGVGGRGGPRWRAIERPREMLLALEVRR